MWISTVAQSESTPLVVVSYGLHVGLMNVAVRIDSETLFRVTFYSRVAFRSPTLSYLFLDILPRRLFLSSQLSMLAFSKNDSEM